MKVDLAKLPEELERQAQLFCDLAGDKRTGKLLVLCADEIRRLRAESKQRHDQFCSETLRTSKLERENAALQASVTDYCMEIDRVMKERDTIRSDNAALQAALEPLYGCTRFWLESDPAGTAHFLPRLRDAARAALTGGVT